MPSYTAIAKLLTFQARETTVKKKRSEQKVQRRNEQREEREYMLQMFL